MKGKTSTILLIVIFLAGLSLLLYPTVSHFINSLSHAQSITDYTDQVKEMGNEESAKLWDAAVKYNQRLLDRVSQTMLPDEMREEYYSALLSPGSQVMGFVEIPTIGVKLPIHHGTDKTTLAAAIGHLEWSSLPVGGESTHCVISGHRGLPSSELFTNIDRLELGDTFMFHVLGETLTYRVDNIAIVEPYDYALLTIEEGKDYATLVTCTPYGINSHRLLIRGSRVITDNGQEAPQDIQVRDEITPIDPIYLVPITLVALVLLVALLFLLDGRKKKKGGTLHRGKYEKKHEES